jgi:hypothetical protein
MIGAMIDHGIVRSEDIQLTRSPSRHTPTLPYSDSQFAEEGSPSSSLTYPEMTSSGNLLVAQGNDFVDLFEDVDNYFPFQIENGESGLGEKESCPEPDESCVEGNGSWREATKPALLVYEQSKASCFRSAMQCLVRVLDSL